MEALQFVKLRKQPQLKILMAHGKKLDVYAQACTNIYQQDSDNREPFSSTKLVLWKKPLKLD